MYIIGPLRFWVVSLLCVDIQCRKQQHEGDKETLNKVERQR
jgi:hypothetical protein